MTMKLTTSKINLACLPKEHEFYVRLIDFLSPLYPTVENSTLQSLSTASYNYFRFLLSFDEFVDSRNDTSDAQMLKFINLKDGFSHYEQSICGLAYLFSSESNFGNLSKFARILISKQSFLKNNFLLQKHLLMNCCFKR